MTTSSISPVRMHRARTPLALALSIVVLLVGCATAKPPTPSTPIATQRVTAATALSATTAASVGSPATSSSPTSAEPASEPATINFTFTFTENPFKCDGTGRPIGSLIGATPGEPLTYTSPGLSLLSGTAAANGTGRLIWQCNPDEAGKSWVVTAHGGTSGIVTSFEVTGI